MPSSGRRNRGGKGKGAAAGGAAGGAGSAGGGFGGDSNRKGAGGGWEGKGRGDGKGKGKGGKGKGKGKGAMDGEITNPQLMNKAYKDGLDDLIRSTVARSTDIAPQAFALLDFLQERGRANEACAFLKESLLAVTREQVSNWRGYIYTLLRGFDESAYAEMLKSQGKQLRERVPPEEKPQHDEKRPQQEQTGNLPESFGNLNANAVEFVPGQLWLSAGSR